MEECHFDEHDLETNNDKMAPRKLESFFFVTLNDLFVSLSGVLVERLFHWQVISG